MMNAKTIIAAVQSRGEGALERVRLSVQPRQSTAARVAAAGLVALALAAASRRIARG